MLRPPVTPTLKLLLGLGLCSLGGAMLYVYFKNRDEEDELEAIDAAKIKKKKEITLQLIVSNEIIPVVVGRSGANLKIIEEKTATVIRFREKDDDNQYCEIRGTTDAVKEAKLMLMKEIQRSPTVKEEIYVPQSACGKIIGRCGESLQEICRLSHAKVSVESGDRSTANSTRRIVITGNRHQVNIAKKLIEDKITEDEQFKKELEEAEQKREPRRSPTNSVSSNHSSLTSLSSYLPPKEKFNLSDEKPMEVYVSAIASPAKFWVQLIGPQSRQLDELVENMSEYYNNEENQSLHKIADPYLGQIVAALFKYDGKWYRAEIVGILPNEYNPRDVVLDLYFVDYGDSEYVAPHEVFELRTDFLTLRFQAIECFLAHVKPALDNDSNNPDHWDPQAIAKFEELTQVANWKKLISRVVTYKERPKGGNHIRREGSPVPGVELYDLLEGVEVNIGHVLISHGYAMPEYPKADDVLRLGGGDSLTLHNSLENIPNGNHKINPTQNDCVATNNDENPMRNGSYNRTKNYFFDPNKIQPNTYGNNQLNSTEKLLEAEKMNGNSVSVDDKNNLINGNSSWNHSLS